MRDKEVVDTELQLKDLETIEGRWKKAEHTASGGDPHAKAMLSVLKQVKPILEAGKNARTLDIDPESEEGKCFRELFLLTAKPVLYVCNVTDDDAVSGNAFVDAVREAVKDEEAQVMVMAAQMEADIAELDTYEERQEFLEAAGLSDSGVSRLDPDRLCAAWAGDLLYGGEEGDSRLDLPEGKQGPAGSGRDPLRL